MQDGCLHIGIMNGQFGAEYERTPQIGSLIQDVLDQIVSESWRKIF